MSFSDLEIVGRNVLKIYELKERTQFLPGIVEVWEDSVRATHLFLLGAEVLKTKEYVPQALSGVEHLIVAESDTGNLIGFMGTGNGRLEMLFLASAERGKGTGKRLLQYGIENYWIREVTVNEQNPQAELL